MRNLRVFLLLSWLGAPLVAQTASRTIQSTGTASVSATPDQAQFTVSVVTQGTSAQNAGTQNAAQTTTLINALESALGTNGSVQTVGYSISPRYNNASPPAIVGYTATNTVQVTDFNLSNVGSLIDTANQAGGSSVSGISFGLQNPDPYVQQALGLAAKQALAHANAIAGGLGAKAGSVLSALEGTTYTPVVASASPVAVTTPVVTGTVQVTASVTVTVQLTP
ncbi:MAG: SIMPL domain-containing protein [Bryobacteraceae bacterium]